MATQDMVMLPGFKTVLDGERYIEMVNPLPTEPTELFLKGVATIVRFPPEYVSLFRLLLTCESVRVKSRKPEGEAFPGMELVDVAKT